MNIGLSKIITGALLTGTLLSTQVSALTTNHFGDGFNYANSNYWNKSNGWSNGGMFDCTWRDKNVNFYDGVMELSITKDIQYGVSQYASGEYRSNDTYGYGLYQVSMKPAKNIGIVSSFFTYIGPTDNSPWDEIDIEFLGKDTTKVQFNYYTNGVGNHEHIYNLGFDASESFHTYAFNWQKNYIAWLVDGKEVYKVYGDDIPSHPGKIMMNLWPGKEVDSWLGKFNGITPIKAYYDWISYEPM